MKNVHEYIRFTAAKCKSLLLWSVTLKYSNHAHKSFLFLTGWYYAVIINTMIEFAVQLNIFLQKNAEKERKAIFFDYMFYSNLPGKHIKQKIWFFRNLSCAPSDMRKDTSTKEELIIHIINIFWNILIFKKKTSFMEFFIIQQNFINFINRYMKFLSFDSS